MELLRGFFARQEGFVLLTLVLVSPALSDTASTGKESDRVGAVKVVIAEGVGAGTDKAKARDDAIADAQRRAVEQGVGLYLESDTLVANAVLVEDTIYRNSRGYVHTYEVVSERYRDGECRVKIRAQVRVGKIEEDLQEVWERLKVTGSPRVIVAIDQPQPSDMPNLAQTTVTDKLVNYGFKVLDARQLAQSRWKDAMKLVRAGQPREADILSLQDAADILIVGQANYRSLGKPETDLDVYSCQAFLDARAIRTDTAEVIAASRGATARAHPAFREDQAIEGALKAAAEDWIARNLGLLVKAAVDPAHGYTLLIRKCKHSDLDAIDSQLQELRFVRQTRLRAFDNGLAQLEVEFLGTAKRLAAHLATFKGPKLRVESITASTIRVCTR